MLPESSYTRETIFLIYVDFSEALGGKYKNVDKTIAITAIRDKSFFNPITPSLYAYKIYFTFLIELFKEFFRKGLIVGTVAGGILYGYNYYIVVCHTKEI